MKISKVKFHNFRIYAGDNEILFSLGGSKNINIIAGKNGFGKTTFLTSLIWVFYGRMMSEVEDKYKRDIKNVGGYEKFVKSLINRDIIASYEDHGSEAPIVSVEIELRDILIPSIPCKSVVVKRSYDLRSDTEDLKIFIDGLENELTKEVGYEIFINDFILPREIAKFFFFDAEKIVSLAEAKTKSELKNLSKAYSEVLGIKKYEDLKKNLETLLTKLRRTGASPTQQGKLEKLIEEELEISQLIELNLEKQSNIDKEIQVLRVTSDSFQEKLIREGNGITLEELQKLKTEHSSLKQQSVEIKSKLKKLMDIAPLVIAGKKLYCLKEQLKYEQLHTTQTSNQALVDEKIREFSRLVISKIDFLSLDTADKKSIVKTINETIKEKGNLSVSDKEDKILLDYTSEQHRNFDAIYTNIRGAFSSQFNAIVKEEKNNKIYLSKVSQKIKQAEARKGNHLAERLREDKLEIDNKIEKLIGEKYKIVEEYGTLKVHLSSKSKVLSEYERNFNLAANDKKKYEVTEQLLTKINTIIYRIKEDKKYSLQKSVLLGLKKLMHKNDFIHNVTVNVVDDVMDLDLLDKNGHVIDKDLLSKGEQQLYATALLKALVDESGIKFPVFIDSPLQKFDKYHSKNIITEFYPAISEQVVLFPLLEKELSELEYEYLKPNVSKVFTIENFDNKSSFKSLEVDQLFVNLTQEQNVYSD